MFGPDEAPGEPDENNGQSKVAQPNMPVIRFTKERQVQDAASRQRPVGDPHERIPHADSGFVPVVHAVQPLTFDFTTAPLTGLK
jgi:hypothetical protein